MQIIREHRERFSDQSAHINRALILVVCTLSRWERMRARWKKLFQRTEQFDYRRNRIGRWLTVSIEPFRRKNALAIIKTVTHACEARRSEGECSVSENVTARFYIA